MLLWTIQHVAAYKVLLETGRLFANEKYLFCEEDFRFAYDWLSKQMKKRIGMPPIGMRLQILLLQ